MSPIRQNARDPDAMASHWTPEGVEDLVPQAVRHIRDFLRAHAPVSAAS